MEADGYTWDLFIAHAKADEVTAEILYDLLEPFRIFLSSRCLLLGDDWDHELRQAQKESLITVVLISSNTDEAYYQRDEIAAAINLARQDKNKHRVVPLLFQHVSPKLCTLVQDFSCYPLLRMLEVRRHER